MASSASGAAIPDKKLIDCYWFLQGKCIKGNACEYRHCEATLNNPTNCKFWMEGKCTNPNCYFRHPSGVHVDRSKTPCVFYLQGTCTKGASCPFSHELPNKLKEDEEKLRYTAHTTTTERHRKLQEERKREEQKLAELRKQSEELRKLTEKKAQATAAATTKPATKREERRSTARDASQGGTFVKSVDEILREKKRENIEHTKVASRQAAKPQTKSQKQQIGSVAVQGQKRTAQAPKKQQQASASQSTPQKANFGVKTLEQILQEKAMDGSKSTTEPTKSSPKASPSTAPKNSPGMDSNYLQQLKLKNEKKFGSPPSSAQTPSSTPPKTETGAPEKKRKEPSTPATSDTKKRKVDDEELSKLDAEIKELEGELDIDVLADDGDGTLDVGGEEELDKEISEMEAVLGE